MKAARELPLSECGNELKKSVRYFAADATIKRIEGVRCPVHNVGPKNMQMKIEGGAHRWTFVQCCENSKGRCGGAEGGGGMPRTNYLHVVPRGDRWAVKREGAERASSMHRTQGAATNQAVRVAKREHGEVFIHNKENIIRDRDSYGHDPFPRRDKKH